MGTFSIADTRVLEACPSIPSRHNDTQRNGSPCSEPPLGLSLSSTIRGSRCGYLRGGRSCGELFQTSPGIDRWIAPLPSGVLGRILASLPVDAQEHKAGHTHLDGQPWSGAFRNPIPRLLFGSSSESVQGYRGMDVL